MPAKIMGGAAELYLKPSTGQLIIRKIGLDTSSKLWQDKVKPKTLTFAEKMKGHSFPSACKCKVGTPKGACWRAFKGCLRREGHDRYAKGA